jgi:penicillin-binding protein 2
MNSGVAPIAEPPARPPTPEREARRDLAARLHFIRRIVITLLTLLVLGVAYRQLGQSADYQALDRQQNERRVIEPAPRGIIYDREHRFLVTNRTVTRAVLHLGSLREEFLNEERAIRRNGSLETTESAGDAATAARARAIVVQRHLDRINTLLKHTSKINEIALDRHFARDRKSPFTLIAELSDQEISQLSSQLSPNDPVQLARSYRRTYPGGSVAAHVLGRARLWMQKTSSEETFPVRSYLGATGEWGMEKQHEAHLHGRPGYSVYRVDAFGFALQPALEHRDPVAGQDLVLSLDLNLQRAAERAMNATPGGPRGAAVAIAVNSGEVLVMASKPDFDLNLMSDGLSPTLKNQIDADGAWLNRATQGLYSPGSSFKVFTVLAGLRSGTLQSNQTYHCPGYYDVAGHRFSCHQAAGHGEVSLRNALAQSCNVFAYQVGLAAGPEALAAEARRFHLGEPTGVDLPFETQRMIVPDAEWKKSAGRGEWTSTDTVNLSIGQGYLRFSPLQAACAMASLARRETLTVPTLLHQPGRSPTGERKPEPLEVSDEQYATLIDSMRAVVETGIGRNAQVPGIRIAGKTGTAQVSRKAGTGNIAWFVAFAPVEKPEIAVAVALEGKDPEVEFAGAEHAAPVVSEIIGTYFEQRRVR